jgi:hypothetical protein
VPVARSTEKHFAHPIMVGLLGLALSSACAPLPEEELASTEQALIPDFQIIRWDAAASLPALEENRWTGTAVAVEGETVFAASRTNDNEEVVDRFRQLPILIQGKWRKFWFHAQRMREPGGGGQRFGTAIAVHGDTLVIGAPRKFSGDAEGAVYVYQQSEGSWKHAQTLAPPEGMEQDDLEFDFGSALHLSDNLLVIGAHRYGRGKGAAYIYERVSGRFRHRQTLKGTPSVTDMNFGMQVASMGDLVLVSEPGAGLMLRDDGRVWVYRRGNDNTWSQEDMLAVNERTIGDYFGGAFAVNGNRVAVRSYDKLHLYELRDGSFEPLWSRDARWPGVPRPGQLAMDSSSILVGYPSATTDDVSFAGAVVSYAHGRTKLPIHLTSPSVTASAYFGKALAMDGNLAVIAEPDGTHELGKGFLRTFVRSSVVPLP